MIKPPAMGVFARDAPLPTHTTSTAPQPLAHTPSNLGAAVDVAADLNPDETMANQPEEDGQDDDQGTVDEEAGVIRCICSCDEDDGFTIQCDRCLVWQHCACFGMSQASVPDEYLCEQCAPRPVDVAFAVAHQQKRKNNEARKALMDRNLKKQAQAMVSANYTQDYLSKEAAASSSKASPSPIPPQTSAESALPEEQASLPASVPYTTNRSRKPSQALDLTNTQFVVPDVPASAGSSGRGSMSATKQRKGQKGFRRGPDTPTAATTPSKGAFTPGSSNERHEDPFDQAEQLESWHVEFTPISKNVVADPSILNSLAAAMLDWEDGSPLKATATPAGRVTAPVLRQKQCSVIRSHDAMDEDEAYSPQDVEPPGDNSIVTLSAVGNECVPVEMQGPSLADLAARTYVRHISETASAGVFSNVTQVSNVAEEPQRGWCASKAFSRPVMHGLFADSPISAGTFISEFRGELYSADSYRNNPINQFAALGATKSHVHLFPPPLNLAIDARRFGNEARFARFSCHPNAVLKPILFRRYGHSTSRSHASSRAQSPLPFATKYNTESTLTAESSFSDEPELLFGIFAIADIPRTHEVTLGWEWDDSHIVHFLPELVRNPYMLTRKNYDANKHTANMVALAEKGDFPYAYTEFAAKMSTVAAALLGSVLCSCIGSAAPPGGGGGASTNNGRKQDCVVAQMLRVGNGMSLLNVPMPGKSNRRAKLPDFTPLVGISRYWRVLSLPPTPDTSVKDHDSGSSALDNDERSQAILASHINREDPSFGSLAEDLGCGTGGLHRGFRFTRSGQGAVSGSDSVAQDDHSDDNEDARSAASSLTDPLSGLSYDDSTSDEDDVDLARALRLADELGSRPMSIARGRTSQQESDNSGLFLLPPKKRSMRTRIKATMSPLDDFKDDDDLDEDETARIDSRRQIGAGVKIAVLPKKGVKRKTARLPSRLSVNFDSEDDDPEPKSTLLKKRRKSGKIADPSSPLSSVPSPGTDRSSLSPSLDSRTISKRRNDSDVRHSDIELSKQKRAARRRKERGSKTLKKASRESASRLKTREETRSHRDLLQGFGDSASSDDAAGDDDRSKNEGDQSDLLSNTSSMPNALTGSLIKTDRSSPVRRLPKVDRDRPVDLQNISETSVKGDMIAFPSDSLGPSINEASAKIKKTRRVVSDSENSENEATGSKAVGNADSTVMADDNAPTEVAKQAASLSASHDEAGLGSITRLAPTDMIAGTNPSSQTAISCIAEATAKAPEIEVKKEEPRVKLSLAEYKRRLAERRVSEKQQQHEKETISATAEVPPTGNDGSFSPEKLDSLAQALRQTPTTAGAAQLSKLTATSNLPHASALKTNDKQSVLSVEPSRSFLFTSTSAPTAIRSVEIPKSPSPDPMPPYASGEVELPDQQTERFSAAGDSASLRAKLESRRAQGQNVVTATAATSGRSEDFTAQNTVTSDLAAVPSLPVLTTSSPGNAPTVPPAMSASHLGHHPPASPSKTASFNPPKAPRALVGNVPSTPSAAGLTGGVAQTLPSDRSANPVENAAVFSGAAPTSNSPALPRYSGTDMTSPSPSAANPVGSGTRDFTGIPKGPASMRDHNVPPATGQEAWAEVREQRELPGRSGIGGGSDHNYRGAREPAWGERERMRWERDNSHRADRAFRDPRSASRDDREMSVSAQSGRLDHQHHHHHQQQQQQYSHPHAHERPYRRPSMSEYDDQLPPAGSPYERSSDPYSRGMVGPPRDSRELRDYRELHDYRDPRDYDHDGGGVLHPSQHPYGSHTNRGGSSGGGYRGGWGGGGRPRGRGMGSRGGARGGGWSR